ncbi:MAG: hypothetical protein M9921_15705 [Fimbriimonadaceae bacterium]|nr:hypothetical protein [Fimbriimonadaceae bacterium]
MFVALHPGDSWECASLLVAPAWECASLLVAPAWECASLLVAPAWECASLLVALHPGDLSPVPQRTRGKPLEGKATSKLAHSQVGPASPSNADESG